MNRTGNVYGRSLYLLASEEGLEEQILQELSVLESVFAQEPDYLKLLSARNLPKQERLDVLQESFGGKVHTYVLNFLKLLTEKGYMTHFLDCCRAYREQYNEEKGILQVNVVSAVALSQEQKQKLTEKLTAMTGKQVFLVCREDPTVLGGIRLAYDGIEVDGTVQNRLQAVEKTLRNTVL
ncbi:MAG: ATP synthase F1 subunit delta [Oscillospiraceae bacterium]|nr:ATP synthase F1 subunit delta [Oscillospiraceae bacterium]